jgi:hypothetical protein
MLIISSEMVYLGIFGARVVKYVCLVNLTYDYRLCDFKLSLKIYLIGSFFNGSSYILGK